MVSRVRLTLECRLAGTGFQEACPDPFGAMSKRRWEFHFKSWRDQLRNSANLHFCLVEMLEGLEEQGSMRRCQSSPPMPCASGGHMTA